MKINVDFDKCASNAQCMKACPDVFEVREDGFLYILQEEPPEALRESVEQAMHACPTGAISIEG
jgi:ferredoxin